MGKQIRSDSSFVSKTPQDGAIVRARFVPLPEHIGFKDTVHGGLSATVLDEIMVWACAVRTGRFGYCAELNIRFLSPARPGEEVIATGELVANRRDKNLRSQGRTAQCRRYRVGDGHRQIPSAQRLAGSSTPGRFRRRPKLPRQIAPGTPKPRHKIMLGCEQNSSLPFPLPHKCGVPAGHGTPPLGGSEEFCPGSYHAFMTAANAVIKRSISESVPTLTRRYVSMGGNGRDQPAPLVGEKPE